MLLGDDPHNALAPGERSGQLTLSRYCEGGMVAQPVSRIVKGFGEEVIQPLAG